MSYPSVVANVAVQAFTPAEEFFGIPLVAGTVSSDVAAAWAELYPDNPRTLSLTPNSYKTAMAALGLVAGDTLYKRVVDIFSQQAAKKVTTVILGRRLDPVAQVIRLTVGGDTDGDYSVQIDEQDPLVYTASGKTAAEIRTALLALLDANPIVTEATQGAASIDLTSVLVGYAFSVTLASPGDVLTQAVQVANVGYGEDLTALRVENQLWFDHHEVGNGEAAAREAAKWAQANASHAWIDTNAAAVKTNSAGNLAAWLKDKGYTECSIRYHHTASEGMSAALMGQVLGFETGQIQVSHRGLVGVTKKNYSVEAGVIAAFEANHVGWYDSSGGGRVLYNRTPAGGFIELERGKWVCKARIENALLALLKNNPITAYTDEEGVASAKGALLNALRELGTGGGTGFIRTDTVIVELLTIEQMGTDNNAKLKITGISWAAKVRIGTNEIEINGFLQIV